MCGVARVLLEHTGPVVPDSRLEPARTVLHATSDSTITGVAAYFWGLALNAH